MITGFTKVKDRTIKSMSAESGSYTLDATEGQRDDWENMRRNYGR